MGGIRRHAMKDTKKKKVTTARKETKKILMYS